MIIDFNFPVQRKDGKRVVVLTTQGPLADFPVVGYVEGEQTLQQWSEDGYPIGWDTGWSDDLRIENSPAREDFYLQITSDGRVVETEDIPPSDKWEIVVFRISPEKNTWGVERGVNPFSKAMPVPLPRQPQKSLTQAFVEQQRVSPNRKASGELQDDYSSGAIGNTSSAENILEQLGDLE